MNKREITIPMRSLAGKTLNLGYVGENLHTRIIIDCTEELCDYPNATINMAIRSPHGDIYPVQPEKDGWRAIWDVTGSDLVYAGSGQIQVTLMDGEEIIKSAIGNFTTSASLETTGPAPEPLQNWMDAAEQTAAQIAEDAAEGVVDDLADAKDEAIAAIEAKGEEVIEEIPADYTQLSEDVSNVKSAINDIKDDMRLPQLMAWDYTSGYWIVTTGTSINTGSPYTVNTGYAGRCTFMECEEGDVFLVSLYGAANQRSYAFCSSDGTIIERGPYNTQLNGLRVVAPENAAYVAFNSISNDTIKTVYLGDNPIDALDRKIDDEADRIDNNISILSDKMVFSDINFEANDLNQYISTEWENGWINNGNNQSNNGRRRTIKNYKLNEGDVFYSKSYTTNVVYFKTETDRGTSNLKDIGGITGFYISPGVAHIVTAAETAAYFAFYQSETGTIETDIEMIHDKSFVIVRYGKNPLFRMSNYPYIDNLLSTAFKTGENKIPFYAIIDGFVGNCVVSEGEVTGTGYSPSEDNMYEAVDGPYKNATGSILLDSITKPFKLKPGLYGNNTKVYGTIGAYFYDKNGVFISKSVPINGISSSQLNRNVNVPANAEYIVLQYNHDAKPFLSVASTYFDQYYAPIIELNTVDNRIDEEKTMQSNMDAETDETESEVKSADLGFVRFVYTTDTHQNEKLDYERRIMFEQMNEMAKKLSCDFIMHTGDIINGNTSGTNEPWMNSLREFKSVFEKAECPVVVCRGNHDDNSSTVHTSAKIISNAFFNNEIVYTINKRNDAFVKPDGGNGYFYLDLTPKKIRVVCINASDLTDAERIETGGQNWMKISQDQLDWLDDTALNVEEGWKMICCSHVHALSGPNASLENKDALLAVLDAHKENILGYFFGHTHTSADFVDQGIRWISVNAGGAGGGGGFSTQGYSQASNAAKEASPTGKYLFDIVEVYHNGDIKRYRWGVQDDVSAGATPPVYENAL